MADRVKLDDRAFRARINEVVTRGMMKGALGMVGHVKQKLGVSARVLTPHGQAQVAAGKRPSGKKSYDHEASRPGEPPRKRTGTLQKSVAASVYSEVSSGAGAIMARVGASAAYAKPLEYGAPRKNLKARPFLRPSLVEYAPKFVAIVNTELRRRLRKAGV